MFKNLLVTVSLGVALATSSIAQASDRQLETYQRASTAVEQGDFGTLRQVLTLQPGLTFDALEANWSRAQEMFQSIFPAPDQFSVVERFETSGGASVWIVEMNEVEGGSKLLKAYKFSRTAESASGWKVSASRQSGSYTHPDAGEIKAKVVEDIRRGVESES